MLRLISSITTSLNKGVKSTYGVLNLNRATLSSTPSSLQNEQLRTMQVYRKGFKTACFTTLLPTRSHYEHMNSTFRLRTTNSHDWNSRREYGTYNDDNERRQRARNMAFGVSAAIVGFVGFAYASVPLYRMFCNMTGYAGTVQTGKSVSELSKKQIGQPLEPITVYFNSDVNPSLPWKFEPLQYRLTTMPGESTLAMYRASNLTDQPIIGVATYNVAPQKAGFYFNKIQCFCFEQQRLEPGEVVDMPVFFIIDPDIQTNPNTKDIKEITLSYTFFRAPEQ